MEECWLPFGSSTSSLVCSLFTFNMDNNLCRLDLIRNSYVLLQTLKQ